jgi:geranylgeranyl diphosphate synthase type I
MDASDTRRGKPSIHKRFETMHEESKWLGDKKQFGSGGAILLGDLLLSWADEMLINSGLSAPDLFRGKKIYDLMRTELMAGQYLDIFEQARGGGSIENALNVIRYKSAKYTIERPLHLGGALATDNKQILQTYTDYGLPLGEAFQLRDDVLGVFGDPSETGKPAGDDLREGKRTVLIEMTYQKANDSQKSELNKHFGKDLDAQGVATLREVVTATGALSEVESMISNLLNQSQQALAEANITAQAKEAFSELALAATSRRV